MVVINLSSLIDASLKIKQSYITSSTKQKVNILREDVTISRSMKFNISSVQKLMRCLLRLGFFPSEVEFEADGLSMTDVFRIVFEYTTNSYTLKSILHPLARELIEDDVKVELKQSQIEIIVIETNKGPLKELQTIYEPIGAPIVVGAYGTIDMGGQLSYIFSLSLKGVAKKACIKYLLPTEVVTNSDLVLSQKTSTDVFSLPDRTKILYSKKTDSGFIVDGGMVTFGKASFLKSVLPEAGWFMKLNKKVGKNDTILLIETSWELTASQKAYVQKHISM